MTPGNSATLELALWQALFGLFFVGFLAVSLASWITCLVYRNQIFTWPHWKSDQPDSRIGLIDLVAFFCCMLISQLAAIAVLRPFIKNGLHVVSELPAWLAPVVAFSYLLAVLLSVGLLTFRTRATLRQLGLIGSERFLDVQVGVMAFVLATPVILIVSGVLNYATEIEYEHPVIESMRQHPWTFPFLFLGAVVYAPLWEEYAFRGLLIRWLDSIRSSRGDLRRILLGGVSTRVEPSVESLAHSEHPTMNPREALAVAPVVDRYPPWWPAMVSGVLFGLAHFSYGISWVPLILLGTMLGRLFQLRQSILPCVVVHACFNGLSMIGLAAQVLSAK